MKLEAATPSHIDLVPTGASQGVDAVLPELCLYASLLLGKRISSSICFVMSFVIDLVSASSGGQGSSLHGQKDIGSPRFVDD